MQVYISSDFTLLSIALGVARKMPPAVAEEHTVFYDLEGLGVYAVLQHSLQYFFSDATISLAAENVCPDDQILQFPSRYLEWIMIARQHSIDPSYSLDLSARADSLTADERKEVLSVSNLIPFPAERGTYPWMLFRPTVDRAYFLS